MRREFGRHGHLDATVRMRRCGNRQCSSRWELVGNRALRVRMFNQARARRTNHEQPDRIPIRKQFFISSMRRCAATRWWGFCWRFSGRLWHSPLLSAADRAGDSLLCFCWTPIPWVLGFIECFFMPGRVREFNAIQAAGIAAALGIADAGLGPAVQRDSEYASARLRREHCRAADAAGRRIRRDRGFAQLVVERFKARFWMALLGSFQISELM